MICPAFHIHLFLSLVICSLAGKHEGHMHRPDTAPEMDLLPAVRITRPESTTWRTTQKYNHNHFGDFSLPTVPNLHSDHANDFEDHTEDYNHDHGESGDYDRTVVHTETMLHDEDEDLSNEQFKSSAADNRSSLILMLAIAMTAALIML